MIAHSPATHTPAVPSQGLTSRVRVERFDTIDLDGLNATSALMTRVDRKYLARPEQVEQFLQAMPRDTRVLSIDGRTDFGYRSTYFDTPDLTFYLQAARRRPRRLKVRTRHYLDSDLRWLEVKSRTSGWTHKQRVAASAVDSLELDGHLLVTQTSDDLGLREVDSHDLVPVLTCDYRRTTLQSATGDSRVTLDADLWWHDSTHSLALGDWVVIETKGGQRPAAADRLLWRAGLRPSRTSKYCTGLAALHPALPHNRWHRTLVRLAA